MIRSMGVGSGLDINSIISQLMVVEAQPLNKLQATSRTLQTQVSSVGQIKSLLSTVQSASNELKNITNLQQYTATSTDTALEATVASGGNISTGKFDITISTLAQAHKMASTTFNSNSDPIGEQGTIQVQVGAETFDIVIDGTNDSLVGIRDAINDATDNKGVTASILSAGTEANPEYRLVLTADNTGAANTVGITDVSGNVASTLNISTQIVAAQDATFSVDGFSVTRSDNTVSDVVEGVTLSLKETEATTFTLDVSKDQTATNEKVEEKITTFIDAYNDFINTADNYLVDELSGDGSLRLIKTQLNQVLTTDISGAGTYTALSQIGITQSPLEKLIAENGRDYVSTGKLSLSSTGLSDALEADFDSVVNIFADDANGISEQLDTYLEELLQIEGLLDGKLDSIEAQTNIIDDRISRENQKLGRIEQDLVREFTALDSLVASLQSQSNFLTQQLSNMPKIGSSNS